MEADYISLVYDSKGLMLVPYRINGKMQEKQTRHEFFIRILSNELLHVLYLICGMKIK